MLWFSRRYSLSESELLKGCSELHSHLLPSVDDGVSSFDESLEILTAFESMGYRKVVITPHISTRFSKNSNDTLRASFEAFNSQYTGGLELMLGAEYRVDDNFKKFEAAGDWLLVNDRWLLVETYLNERSMFFGHVIYELQISGVDIMLAHPERYLYMSDHDYESMRDRMVLQQLDLFSLMGHYGAKVEQRANKLLLSGHYDVFGSDIHSSKQLQFFKEKRLTSKQLDALMMLR